MKQRAIKTISRDEALAGGFARRYLGSGGEPVVVDKALLDWPAMERWTFDYLASRPFRRTAVMASAPLSEGSGFGPEDVCEAIMTVGAYIAYAQDPQRRPGCSWVRGDWAQIERMQIPLYIGRLNLFTLPGGQALLEEVQHRLPYLPDGSRWLPRAITDRLWSLQNHYYLFISAPGALTPLHYDFWSSHAYLAQIHGEKEAYLFSPSDSEHLYDGEFDPRAPDLDRHPALQKVTAWTGRLRAGQLLLIPAGWWHFVVTRSTSITFSYNWFDHRNALAYLGWAIKELSWAARHRSARPQPWYI